MKDIAFIGDVHGWLAPLEDVIAKALQHTNRLVFLGDYVNRGPQSSEVISYLLSLQLSKDVQARFVAGNHDRVTLKVIDGDRADLLLRMGGAATIRSYVKGSYDQIEERFRAAIPQTHVDFLRALEPRIDEDDFCAVHEVDEESKAGDRYVIAGHDTQTSVRPLITDQLARIDTGCGTIPEGRLTAFFWPSRNWVQSEATTLDAGRAFDRGE